MQKEERSGGGGCAAPADGDLDEYVSTRLLTVERALSDRVEVDCACAPPSVDPPPPPAAPDGAARARTRAMELEGEAPSASASAVEHVSYERRFESSF